MRVLFATVTRPFRKVVGWINANDMYETYGPNPNGKADKDNLAGTSAANLIGGAGLG